jgi:hypothetical protein
MACCATLRAERETYESVQKDPKEATRRLALLEDVAKAAAREHDRVPAKGMTIAACVRPIRGCSVCSVLDRLRADGWTP